MCFFSPDGDLDIQERPARYRGEPRRKRLAFVKDPSSKRSDDDWDTRTYRSSHRSSVPEMGGYRDSSQQLPHGHLPMAGRHPQHTQHPMFSPQAPHGQFPMAGQHPQHTQHPMFGSQAPHGRPLMIDPQPQFAQPFGLQQPPGAGMMAQPAPNRPLLPGGFQQPLGVGRRNDNDIVEIIEPRRGQDHFERRDQRHIEDGPRARMPRNMRRNQPRGRSGHRDHRRPDESVYSFEDDDDSFGSGHRLYRGSRSGWGSDSDDSFAAPLRSPRRRDSRFRR
jgi:hypothetical protein